MKKFLLLTMALTIAASAFAQQKADLRVMPIVEAARKMKAEQTSKPELNTVQLHTLAAPVAIENADPVIPLLLTLDNANDVARLEELGVEISVAVDNIASVYVPVDLYDQVEALNCVRSIAPVRVHRPYCDLARKATNVDLCHAGTGLDKAYKGDGVIVGTFDSGLDPNHIAFYDANQSKSRVLRMWTYEENKFTHKAKEEVITSASAIASYTTDDKDNTHGTHVLGIATGAYSGPGADYSGMAPNADIAIGCGFLSDDAIIKALSNISSYSWDELERPCVINLSVGSNIGHHDATDATSIAINRIANTTPICIAAGNEGDLNICIKKTCTAGDTKVQTLLAANANQATSDAKYQAFGSVEILCEDKTPFNLIVGVYNVSTRRLLASVSAGQGSYTYLAGSNAPVSGSVTTSSVINSYYSTDSYIGAAKGVCSDNGRYYGFVSSDMYSMQTSMTIFPVIIIEGVAGKKYEVYGDGYYTDFTTMGDSTFDEPTHNGTVNDMACGKEIISVGAYTTRAYSPLNISKVGDVAPFSSYGTLKDGRTVPLVCAPGAGIVSAYSRFYVDGSSVYNRSTEPISQSVNFKGHKNYYSVMAGTSMATPVMTGVVALWCQANPDIYPDEIREVAVKTAKVDTYVKNGSVATSPIQWGAGKLDAYAGLKEILHLGSVESLIDRGNTPILIQPVGDRQYEVFVAKDDNFTVNVTSLSGVNVLSRTSDSDTMQLDLTDLSSGIYIVTVNSRHDTRSEKISI